MSRKHVPVDKEKVKNYIDDLKRIQDDLSTEFEIVDVYSNSKIYEIIIANELSHTPIAGHTGTRNGKTDQGEFEYKHFKESSSNHSWTFNDYSDTVIEKLRGAESVIFAHIDDTKKIPVFDWYIEVDGETCADYLDRRTKELLARQPKGKPNARKMINFSAKQLTEDLEIESTKVKPIKDGRFTGHIKTIFDVVERLEDVVNTKEILTSNKLWEILISIPLNHTVLSEQSGHDAVDDDGNYYEYKVAVNHSWHFQDISENVLRKYEDDKGIILAVVDKHNMSINKIYIADSKRVTARLRIKLKEKKARYKAKGREVRRLSVSLSNGDLEIIKAREVQTGTS